MDRQALFLKNSRFSAIIFKTNPIIAKNLGAAGNGFIINSNSIVMPIRETIETSTRRIIHTGLFPLVNSQKILLVRSNESGPVNSTKLINITTNKASDSIASV
jgi:hypothetical protein